MLMLKSIAVLSVVSQLAVYTNAHPEYREQLPNANNVDGYFAIGHVSSGGGGPRNEFGLAFKAAGLAWTEDLCEADSDGDGQTNGQELGDPCCNWVHGSNEMVLWSTGLSSPGDPESTSDESQWEDLNCSSTANLPVASPEDSGSSGHTTPISIAILAGASTIAALVL